MLPTGGAGLRPGDVLDGKYVLRAQIGDGGMGDVFLADQPALERTVAIKVLHPEVALSPVHVRRSRNEARAAGGRRVSRSARSRGASAAIHDGGVEHAEHKSDKVLVEPRHGVDQVTLIDFG